MLRVLLLAAAALAASAFAESGAAGGSVWTGEELMVFRGARALAYDPTTRYWTTLPPAPILGRPHRDGALYRPR